MIKFENIVRLENMEPRRRRAIFSLRYILYLFSWLCMWQGWHVGGSIFQLNFLSDILPIGFLLHEQVLLFMLFLLIIERMLSGDLTFTRSYFSGPMLLMGFALVFSWTYGMILRQQFTVVYEAHESILIVVSFFIIINIFRDPDERKILMIFFFFATIMKAADSTWIKFFSTDPQKSWGTVLFWRDGFLLVYGHCRNLLILAQYRGKEFRWLRNLMFCFGPFVMYGLIISFRRTFILALVVSAIAMFVTVGKGRRKRQIWLFFAFVIGTLLFVLFTDPVGIIGRLVGALIMPSEEGSSYIRLMEYPNILQNIYHNPIFGVPIGTQWFQYYRMPMFANYTTFGCHNSYLYWPLRTGIIGMFAFLWFLARVWKAIIINLVLQKTEEDFLINQLMLHSMLVYNVASFFGLMYADAMSIMTAFILVIIQLQMIHTSGYISYKRVNLWQTIRQKEIVLRNPIKLIADPV